jgi:integrase
VRQKTDPKYRHYKPKNLGMVVIDGHAHYLGKFDTPESLERYHQTLADWHAGKLDAEPQPTAQTTDDAEPCSGPLLNELIVQYVTEHVQSYYVKAGEPTSEQCTIGQALGFVRRLFGTKPAAAFSPKMLKSVREAMIAHKVSRKVRVKDPKTGKVVIDSETGEAKTEVRVYAEGLARKHINKQINRIRTMFAWAIEEEVLDPEHGARQLVALRTVKPLKRGKSEARERPRVRPVPVADIKAVLPLVPPMVKAMILTQYFSGGRPQDMVVMRPMDIDRTRKIWEYRPSRFKTEHHNHYDDPDNDRIVYLGPRAQRVLNPLLDALGDSPQSHVFSPIRSEGARNAKRKTGRRSPMTPSHRMRAANPKGRTKAPLRDHYDVASYRRAIRRACEKASVPIWHPHRLRHSAGTAVRKRFGLEGSQAVLGHREVGTTQIYAERSKARARRIAAAMG